jgi:hypothetical protein
MLDHMKSVSAHASNPQLQPFGSSIKEAQFLLRQCAEPSPSRDSVKAAIRRASYRLEMPFTRVKDIWYGAARRIDAREMDKFRQVAEQAEFVKAVSAVQTLLHKLESSPSQKAEAIAGLTMALEALKRSSQRKSDHG